MRKATAEEFEKFKKKLHDSGVDLKNIDIKNVFADDDGCVSISYLDERLFWTNVKQESWIRSKWKKRLKTKEDIKGYLDIALAYIKAHEKTEVAVKNANHFSDMLKIDGNGVNIVEIVKNEDRGCTARVSVDFKYGRYFVTVDIKESTTFDDFKNAVKNSRPKGVVELNTKVFNKKILDFITNDDALCVNDDFLRLNNIKSWYSDLYKHDDLDKRVMESDINAYVSGEYIRISTESLENIFFSLDMKTGEFACTNKNSIKKAFENIENNKEALKKLFADDQIKTNVFVGSTGLSILCTLEKGGFVKSVKYETKTEKDKKIDEKKIGEIINGMKNEYEGYLKDVLDTSAYGNIISSEIINIISENQKITEKKLLAVLRGLKVDKNIKKTAVYGKFKLMGEEEILNVVEDLIAAGALQRTRLLNSDYDILQLGDNYEMFKWENIKPANMSDWDLLKYMKTNEFDEKMAATVLERKALVLMYPEKVKEYCRSEYCLDYAQTMYSMEKRGVKKSYWKKVIDILNG